MAIKKRIYLTFYLPKTLQTIKSLIDTDIAISTPKTFNVVLNFKKYSTAHVTVCSVYCVLVCFPCRLASTVLTVNWGDVCVLKDHVAVSSLLQSGCNHCLSPVHRQVTRGEAGRNWSDCGCWPAVTVLLEVVNNESTCCKTCSTLHDFRDLSDLTSLGSEVICAAAWRSSSLSVSSVQLQSVQGWKTIQQADGGGVSVVTMGESKSILLLLLFLFLDSTSQLWAFPFSPSLDLDVTPRTTVFSTGE